VIERRQLEVSAAAITGTFGAAVAWSSLSNGIGWSEAGIQAGTFPFGVGLLAFAVSVYNCVRGLVRGSVAFDLDAAAVRRIAGLFLPACGFVATIPLAGMHVAAALYVFAVLMAARRMPFWKASMLALSTPVALYCVFNRAFQVSLPTGILESVLHF
jgi:hypothetical protein